jgi:hypothetical protein
MQEQEAENAAWAAQESAAIKHALTHAPTDTIHAMCLDPQKSRDKDRERERERVAKLAQITDTTAASGVEGGSGTSTSAGGDGKEGTVAVVATDGDHTVPATTSTSASTSVVADGSAVPVPVSGGHLSGHESRTVYVTGVHACCTKAVLRTAVTETLVREHLPAPERVVISQPVWGNKLPSKFERSVRLTNFEYFVARSTYSILLLGYFNLSFLLDGNPDLT